MSLDTKKLDKKLDKKSVQMEYKKMSYDTTKHNLNWNSYGEAKRHMERHAKIDRFGCGDMKIMHNTRALIDGYSNEVTITLHWTDIYQIHRAHSVGDEFPHSVITLDSGGFRTVTTKDRMNRFLPTGYRISQQNFNWILQVLEFTEEDGELKSKWCNKELYFDGMQIKLPIA